MCYGVNRKQKAKWIIGITNNLINLSVFNSTTIANVFQSMKFRCMERFSGFIYRFFGFSKSIIQVGVVDKTIVMLENENEIINDDDCNNFNLQRCEFL